MSTTCTALNSGRQEDGKVCMYLKGKKQLNGKAHTASWWAGDWAALGVQLCFV